MADHGALVPALSQFARTIVRDYDIDEVLDCFCHQVVAVLGTSGAGVSLSDAAGVLRLVAATDSRIEQIENLQTSRRDGPCFEAYRLGTPVAVEDLAASDRWPGLAGRMLEANLHAVAGVPMEVDGQRIGALAVYSRQARRFGQDDLDVAQTLASVATSYVVNMRDLRATQTLAAQLQHALSSRVVIEQAKGALAAQLGISVLDAFELLRRYARSHQRKLGEVAADIVEGRLGLTCGRPST